MARKRIHNELIDLPCEYCGRRMTRRIKNIEKGHIRMHERCLIKTWNHAHRSEGPG